MPVLEAAALVVSISIVMTLFAKAMIKIRGLLEHSLVFCWFTIIQILVGMAASSYILLGQINGP